MNVTPIQPIEPLEPFVLTVANPRFPIPAGGDFVHCLSADESFLLGVNRGAGSVPLATNRTYRMPAGARFEFLEVRRAPGALLPLNNVVLIVGSGDYKDGALALTAPVSVSSPGSVVDAADQAVPSGVATQILPALAGMREVIVANLSAATRFRIGGANTVGVARGIPLDAGQTLVLTTSGAVWAFQNSGAAQNLSVTYLA